MNLPATNKASAFRQLTTRIATSLLTDWVGEDRAGEAVGRVASALSSSAAASKKPEEFYSCTPQSVAQVVATAALIGIMPGTGPTALAYAIPRRPRKGEAPQLQYSLSHRGLNALARRCGQHMTAIPVGHNDKIDVGLSGECTIASQDVDDPPTTWDELRGVVVVVRDIATGSVLCAQWVPKKIIEARREMSDAWQFDKKKKTKYSPWSNWPVPQAMKTAMKYVVSRGSCVIDDTESVRALANDRDGDVIDGDARRIDEPVAVSGEQPATSLENLTPVATTEEEQSEPEESTEAVSTPSDTEIAKALADCSNKEDVNDVLALYATGNAESDAALWAAANRRLEELRGSDGSE